ncbi:MAG: ABC transporter permease subunit [Bacteroidaceae bacterium]|nr:ABC transporter permease subunit [Bacteroidaceae bacterium]
MKIRKNSKAPLLLFTATLTLMVLSCEQDKVSSSELHSEADLSGHTVSTTAGNYYDNKYSSRDDITMFRVNTEADGIQAVRQGLADVHVTDEVTFTPELRRQLGIRLAFKGEEAFDVAFAVRKGDDQLREQMDRFIDQLKADGTLDAILSHWLEDTPAPGPVKGGEPGAPTPLRCLTGVSMAPICYIGEGGEWMGMDADILKRFAAWSGRTFDMKYQDLGSAMIALGTGQCDVVCACLYITDERKKSVDFTQPYYLCRAGYFVVDEESTSQAGFGERLKMNLLTESRWKLITDGLWETIKITVFAILLGTLLGAGVCVMLRSRRKWMNRSVELYGAFIQGIPTLVLLLVMFYVILASAGLSGTVVAIITFALCFAWSSGSIFSSAISSVPKGQTEAGLSLGLTPFKTFIGIVFPQAIQKALPLYTGECVALLKSTSIVGYIAIMDLTRASDLIRSRTFDAMIPLLVITIAYFVLAWLIRLLLNLFLKK